MAEIRIPRINKAMLSGRIASDLELKTTAKGDAVLKFAVAVDKSSKDASGQWQNSAIFVDCVAWKDTATRLSNDAHKGSAVVLDARLDVQSYTDKDNNKRKSYELIVDYIQILDVKPKDGTEPEAETPATQSYDSSSDVPF